MTVPPGGRTTFTVTLTVDPAALAKTAEATANTTQRSTGEDGQVVAFGRASMLRAHPGRWCSPRATPRCGCRCTPPRSWCQRCGWPLRRCSLSEASSRRSCRCPVRVWIEGGTGRCWGLLSWGSRAGIFPPRTCRSAATSGQIFSTRVPHRMLPHWLPQAKPERWFALFWYFNLGQLVRGDPAQHLLRVY